MRRYTLLLIALIGALALAACGATLPTAEEIVDRMEAARAATTSAHATVAIDFTSPDRSGQIVVEGWTEKTGETNAAGAPISRLRAEVLQASEKALEGTVAVSDGTTFWLYNKAENTVVTGEAGKMKEAAAATPAGPATMLTDLVAQGLDAVDLEVLGSEQVAGKDTWKVKVTPKSETSAQLQLDGLIEGTMWVDVELALPLKLTLDASDLGSGTVEVRSIETNQDIDDALFAFTPPADAEVVQAEDLAAQMQQPKAASLDEARTAVSFTLREPTYLPAGLALVEARVIGTSTVILNYGGDGGSVSLVQSNEDVGRDREPPAGSQVTEVTVGGAPSTLITGGDGEGSLLRWQSGGVRYVVAGTLPGDEAIKVAEGLK
ncbi:MAG: DUF4367 domain-containing protein [Chloroflexales bacterium]|nr:DUF4367 domain-containing protein [Chloroflexales bacterium]